MPIRRSLILVLAGLVVAGIPGHLPALLSAEPAQAPKAPAFTAQQQALLDEAQRLFNEADKLYAEGKPREALEPTRKALEIRLKILGEKNPKTVESISNVGFSLKANGELAAAKPYYEKALAINLEILGPKHLDTATSFTNLGYLLLAMHDFAGARSCLEQALAIHRERLGEKHYLTATSLRDLGYLLQTMDDDAAARPYYEQALAIRREVLNEGNRYIVESLHDLGNVLRGLGDYQGARPYLEEALDIYRKVLGEKDPRTAMALYSVGFLRHRMGDYAAARLYYEQALAIRREVLGAEHPDTANVMNTLGGLLKEMGDYAAAGPYYEQALAIRLRILGEKDPDTATSLNNLGLLYQATGDCAAARPCLEQALAIRKDVLGEKHPAVANALNNLAMLHNETGDYATARLYLEQALAIRKAASGDKHPDTALALNNLGYLLQTVGDYAAARTYYDQALAARTEILGQEHPDTAVSLANLATLAAATGDWAEAARFEDRARRILRQHIARTLPGFSEKEQLVFLQRKGSLLFHAALSLGLHERNDPRLCAQSAAWLLNGKAVAQESLAERALLAREAGNSKSPLAAEVKRLIDVRRQLATLSMLDPKPGQEAQRREKLEELEQEETTRSRRLAQAGGQAVKPEPWVELDNVRQALAAKTALVEVARFNVRNFAATGQEKLWQPIHYAAWIIPRNGEGDVQIVDLGEAAAIDAAVEAARRTLMQPGRAGRRGLDADQDETTAERDFREAPAKLAALVLHPILQQVGDARRLVVSPDAALWLIPWGALPLPDGRYAIEQYEIDYVISGRDLVAPHSKVSGVTQAVVMADPDYDLNPAGTAAALQAVFRKAQPAPANQLAMRGVSTDRGGIAHVDRLPGTAKEARAITPKLTSYAKREPTLYLDRYALEGVFKELSKPKVLVLSTHGFFLTEQQFKPDDVAAAADGTRAAALTIDKKPLENPLLRCGLLLAGCNQRSDAAGESGVDDGILTGMEIVGTDLRGTELVVLSACETGLGEVHNGEGVAGLRQAFQLAGAEAVVASLWQVPDTQTAELMTAFFTKLAAGRSKADALRDAQLDMIKTHRKDVGGEPFYWAAFTLTERGLAD